MAYSEQMATDLKQLQEKQEMLQESSTRIEELLCTQMEKSPVKAKAKVSRNLSVSLVRV